MRILYAHLYDAAFKIGGAEKVLLDLAGAMKRDFGAEVHCAVNRGDIVEHLQSAGIATSEIFWSKAKTLQTLGGLRHAIETFRPDVIHSHHRYTTFLLSAFFKGGNRILHTEHVLRRDKRFLFRFGHVASGVHESVTQNLVQYFGVPESKTRTIPNAVRVPPADPAKLARLQHRFTRSHGEIYALMIGRFEEQKGHHYLVQALEKLSVQEREKIKILLAGSGSLEGSIRTAVAARGLQNYFVFLGHTPEIPELLALCDFLVLPSLFEGMPLSLLEAYAAGKPVIATDIPGSRELVRQGQTGLLVPAQDPLALAQALAQFTGDVAKIAAMGAAARKLSEQEYAFGVMMRRYYELYESMVREIHGR